MSGFENGDRGYQDTSFVSGDPYPPSAVGEEDEDHDEEAEK